MYYSIIKEEKDKLSYLKLYVCESYSTMYNTIKRIEKNKNKIVIQSITEKKCMSISSVTNKICNFVVNYNQDQFEYLKSLFNSNQELFKETEYKLFENTFFKNKPISFDTYYRVVINNCSVPDCDNISKMFCEYINNEFN